jgi:hypothetical protein
MIDIYTDNLTLSTINHREEGQQLVFKNNKDEIVSILLKLGEFEKLYNAICNRVETLSSFEPYSDRRYRLKNKEESEEQPCQ